MQRFFFSWASCQGSPCHGGVSRPSVAFAAGTKKEEEEEDIMACPRLVFAVLLVCTAVHGQPKGFRLDILANTLNEPMDLAFLGDGFVLIPQKSGSIMIANPDTKPFKATVFMTIPQVDGFGERVSWISLSSSASSKDATCFLLSSFTHTLFTSPE
jgi:hypothetical protein